MHGVQVFPLCIDMRIFTLQAFLVGLHLKFMHIVLVAVWTAISETSLAYIFCMYKNVLLRSFCLSSIDRMYCRRLDIEHSKALE